MKEAAQVTGHLLMVRPRAFAANPQTVASNTFQQVADGPDADVQAAALAEFDGVVERLRAAGVHVVALEDSVVPAKPDAVFPNNWVSFHADGTVVLYPMVAPNRRAERRPDLVEALARDHGFRVARVLDLSGLEARGCFLEGTGSMVLDRRHGVAYAALSPRTHPAALAEAGGALGLEVLAFDTSDASGLPLYHANVMLSIGRGFAVICAEVMVTAAQRAAVLARLEATGREVVLISAAQLRAFAGNVLEVATADGRSVLALSETALRSLGPAQRAALARHADLLPLAVPTIERHGGGSVRCMLAEIFLPRAC